MIYIAASLSLLIANMIYLPRPAVADPAPAAQLVFGEINVTGTEFIVLQNIGTAPAELNQYWLGYVSSDNQTAAPSQQLANQQLPAGAALVLTNGSLASCGATDIDNLNFSLANTAGSVDLWQLSGSGAQAAFTLSDAVSWGKSATTQNYVHIADESNVVSYDAGLKPPVTANPTWYKPVSAASPHPVWQVGDLQNCRFTPVTTAKTTGTTATLNWQTDDTSPPFTIEFTVVAGGAPAPAIPASDIGLKAVQVSEILPNPASPQTDAANEFIELYNPNSSSFDLSGFMLQSASTTSSSNDSYHIPAGTHIGGHAFLAFYSSVTHLGLSNSGGEVWLVDPLGNTVTNTDPYDSAKEGYAWINANHKWQWTTMPTPGSANKLAAPALGSSKKTATVKGRKVVALQPAGSSQTVGSIGATTADATSLPIHPWTLALIAALALLYWAYEYRHDIRNRLYQYRSYRAARRTVG